MGTSGVFKQHRHPESQTLLLPLRFSPNRGASGVSQVCVAHTRKGQPVRRRSSEHNVHGYN